MTSCSTFSGDIGLSSKDVPKPLPLSSLTILGLQLTMFPKMSIFGDEKELQNSATVLGYVAHVSFFFQDGFFIPLKLT